MVSTMQGSWENKVRGRVIMAQSLAHGREDGSLLLSSWDKGVGHEKQRDVQFIPCLAALADKQEGPGRESVGVPLLVARSSQNCPAAFWVWGALERNL